MARPGRADDHGRVSDENLYTMFHRAAQAFPEREAIVFEDGVLSYAALDQLVLRVATGLHELGVRPGDRVLTYVPNCPEVLATYFACAYLGAIFAPVNPVFRAREMHYICENAGAAIAIVHAETERDFTSFGFPSQRPRTTVLVGGAPGPSSAEDHLPFDALLSHAEPPPRHLAAPDDPVLICYTSGTTSTPKPVLLSHRNEVYSALTYADTWGLQPDDRAIVCLPLAWAYGLSTTSMSLLSAGAAVLLRRRFHPVEVLDAIEAQRPTIFYGTMSMYTKMLDVLGRGARDVSSLRFCLNGGEACPDGAVRAFQEFTGLRPIQAYAASEAKPLLALRADDDDAPFNSSGRVVGDTQIRLLDEDGTEVTPGDVGEAEVWCPGLMLGYFREPEMTADKLTADGWLKTGDLLVEDGRGYFRVVGRRSEMIIRSGANIAPAEVASAIMGHRGAVDAAVIGIPDALSGEAVVALVVPAGDADVDADVLRQHLADVLAPYKLPSHIIFVEELPTNANGKTDRDALRSLALALLGDEPARSAT
jgi:long-chain acyl-CoA synthetase